MQANPNDGQWKVRKYWGKFIQLFQPESKTLIRKLERILIKLFWQNVSLSLLFNQTCLNERLLPHYIYIYIYIYICIFRQHFFVNANFIKHNRHFMSTYFLLDPFEFPYYFYCILGELIYVLSIVACIPSTFCPTLGHHQGRIYYKSDVTFVLAYYNCVRAVFAVEGFGVCFWMWFYI